jgi:hypothetical protein
VHDGDLLKADAETCSRKRAAAGTVPNRRQPV